MGKHEQAEAVASRRRLLTGGAAAVGSAAGAVLLGATSAEAADGSPILAGRSNTATAATSLTNSSTSGGAHGLLISTKGGYGFQATSASNHGLAGLTSGATKAGVLATHNGPQGSGAALIANGRKNTGAHISNSDTTRPALHVRTTRPNLPTPTTQAVRVDAEGGFGTAIDADGCVVIRATGNSALSVFSEGSPPTTEIDAFTSDVNFTPVALRLSAVSFVPEDPPLVADGFALVATGHVDVDGTIWATTAGTRMIDPTDPDRYLYQSFVEAPERRSMVDGTATIPAAGEVVVDLPPWFVELTGGSESHRYQLTAHDEAMPNLHVQTTDSGDTFTIAGGTPGGTVSWQVTGVRADAVPFARKTEAARASYPSWFRTGHQSALRRGAREAKKAR